MNLTFWGPPVLCDLRSQPMAQTLSPHCLGSRLVSPFLRVSRKGGDFRAVVPPWNLHPGPGRGCDRPSFSFLLSSEQPHNAIGPVLGTRDTKTDKTEPCLEKPPVRGGGQSRAVIRKAESFSCSQRCRQSPKGVQEVGRDTRRHLLSLVRLAAMWGRDKGMFTGS